MSERTITAVFRLEDMAGKLAMREELATIPEEDCPIKSVDTSWPAPTAFYFNTRDGQQYKVHLLRPLVDAVIAALAAPPVEETT